MQADLVPQTLQVDYSQFLQRLTQLGKQVPTQCPYCTSRQFSQTRAAPLTFRCKGCLKYFNPLTATPFNRLHPVDWLAVILVGRTQRDTLQSLADQLDCSIKKVILRDKVIKQVMQTDYPALFKWYSQHNNVNNPPVTEPIPEVVRKQQLSFKQTISQLLTATQANCLYCGSNRTVKMGQRTAFRCNACRRGFNLLHGTPINRLRDAEKWLPFIDLMVEKHNNLAIAAQIGLNNCTIGIWRRRWYAMMQQWQCHGLAAWCKR